MLIKRSHRIAASDDVEGGNRPVNKSGVQTTFFGQLHHFYEHDTRSQITLSEIAPHFAPHFCNVLVGNRDTCP